ncbi:MAG: hypothetical protein HYX50_03210 [Chloroflexi bacterium]|nr:hypothetical protein [Chloroflexota bacterium]
MTWEFAQRWYMPFAWLIATSLFTVPLAIYWQLGMTTRPGADIGLGYGTAWVARDDFLETIAPYVLNLICALWLFSSDGSTRWAAFWAALAAAARIITPFALASQSDVAVAGQHFIDWNTLRVVMWFQDFQMLAFAVMMLAAFKHFVGQSSSAVASSHAYAG